MTFLLLFFEFFKAGLFAIGGGLATLPFLYDIADKYTWFDEAMLSDMISQNLLFRTQHPLQQLQLFPCPSCLLQDARPHLHWHACADCYTI